MKVQIKHRWNDSILYEADVPDDTPSGLQMRRALEAATSAGANLDGAYLAGANLAGANLDGANLDGAYLNGEQKLIGNRPIFQIGPIGSRCSYFVASLTDNGVMVRAGCFFGTVGEFEQKCAETHGDNEHAREYKAALALIQVHAELWSPKAST